jgi:hypothetical protein
VFFLVDKRKGAKLDPLLKIVLLLGAMLFLISAFFIFIYSIYPKNRILWQGTALTFFLGLLCSLLSVFLLIGIG